MYVNLRLFRHYLWLVECFLSLFFVDHKIKYLYIYINVCIHRLRGFFGGDENGQGGAEHASRACSLHCTHA